MTPKEYREQTEAFLLQTIAINDLKGNTKAKECAERELSALREKAKEEARKEAVRCERRSAS